MYTVHDLHQQSIALREEGSTEAALALLIQAEAAYFQENQIEGVIHTLLEQEICWKHWWQKHLNVTAVHAQRLALVTLAHTLAQSLPATQPLPRTLWGLIAFHRAQVEQDGNDLSTAKTSYKTALKHTPASDPQYGTILLHLAALEWHLQLFELAQRHFEEGLQVLTSLTDKNVDSYTRHVWLSGAHLRWAEAISATRPEEAAHHLQLAKEIIDQDDRLVIRRQQWELLNAALHRPKTT